MCYCPTPTLHLNLALTGDCAFQLSPKKPHSVWFISVLKSGDMGQCPEKSPSPCNTCVIPVSLYKSMSWFVTKTRTHTLSHALTHTHTHSHKHTLSRTHTHTHTHSLTQTHSLTHSHTHTHTHSHKHTLSRTHTNTLSHALTHTLVLLLSTKIMTKYHGQRTFITWRNETRRNVNAGHVTMTIIKCIMQYRWRIKTRLNVVYKIKTMLKCLFIFVDQNETKRNVITLFRLVLSRVLSHSWLTSGLPGFRNKTRPIATQN